MPTFPNPEFEKREAERRSDERSRWYFYEQMIALASGLLSLWLMNLLFPKYCEDRWNSFCNIFVLLWKVLVYCWQSLLGYFIG